MDKTILEDKKTILSTNYTPKYEQLHIHPEEGEDFQINDSLAKIHDDMRFIDSFIISKATDLHNLLMSVSERLDNIDLDIKSEQERLQDIKMLCNKYTDFDNIIPINSSSNISGDYSVSNNTFYCAVEKQQKSKIRILDISGNGIEGNKYVYKDYAYVKDSVDTSNRNYIVDNSLTSYYEYERITANASEDYLLNDFNTDSAGAKCTISFYSETPINLITISSDDNVLSVIGIQYSYNGIDYTPLDIPNIRINDKLACYDNFDYVCGDNKILIPRCNFIKITFQSSGTTDDVLAYDRVMFWHEYEQTKEEKAEEDAKDGIIGGNLGSTTIGVAPIYNNIQDATVIVKSAKRHSIKINDIKAVSNIYKTSSFFKTGELIKDCKFYSVALFLNVYMPEQLSSNCVEFIFTINGIDHYVSPINYDGKGNKIFRYSQGKSLPQYTELLNEPINSLSLTVKINGTTEFTPFIGNIKVLLGGEI